MSTYVLGDLHGCYGSLRRLLRACAFRPTSDRLWLVGDLVNRGPQSLQILRWARGLSKLMGDRMVAVLGNHDLHLIARQREFVPARDKDLFDAVLAAPDGEALVSWLERRPLIYREDPYLLVHAGLHPSWTAGEAVQRARRLEARLQRGDTELYRHEPPEGDDPRRDWDDLGCFTRWRTCTADGEPCRWKGPPDGAPEGCLPWFRVPGRKTAGQTVLCGHWAALGLHREPGVIALDSGAAWGGHLTALRLEDDKIFQVPAEETTSPEGGR